MTKKKQLLVERFDDLCKNLEKEKGRSLTRDEEDEAARVLWKILHGENHEPTKKEMEGFWEEIAEESQSLKLASGSGTKPASAVLDEAALRKRLLH